MAYNENTKNPGFQYGRWLSSPPPGEEVVISGMSGRFPESNNIKEFCDHLFKKEEMVTDDGRRWKLDHPEIPQRTAKLPVIDKFDAGNFGVHFRQADNMDPMMRMFMETAVEAIMDAGINPVELEGTKTGVFTSACWSEMETETCFNTSGPQKFVYTGYLRSFISHRISYYLKLKGPSFNSDSACSSSINALDAAFKAMRSGLCENAIVGGVNLLLHPGTVLQFFRLGVLSRDGICRPFDQDANGYVKAEAIACLFVQKSKNSRRIYAQVVNTKTNTNGFKGQGIASPSSLAQQQLMSEIYEESNIHPSELSFLEAHATGTQVGDPSEVEAIDTAIARKRQKTLLVGSIKSNIGHTEPCSGMCSLVKILLAMETGIIAPNLHLKKTKKEMRGFEEGRMKVVTELTELEGEESVVGINNFGFGGSNAHVILRRHKKTKLKQKLPKDDIPILICISGRTEEAVMKMVENINPNNLDMEFVGLLHQMHKVNMKNHLYRGYTIISKSSIMKTSSKLLPSQPTQLCLFFGQFTKNYKSLAAFLLNFPIFKTTISRINKLLNRKNTLNFGELLKTKTQKEQDILGSICVQVAFLDLLNHIGIYPSAVYGDSYGKLLSAYYYQSINFEELISAAIKISQLDFEFDLRFQKNIKKFNQIQNCESRIDSIDLNFLSQIPESTFILNMSDSHLNDRDVLIVDDDSVSLLDVLGRLYETGHLPQVHKLYPEIQFPVSRSTQMISPSIGWDHKKPWYTYKFTENVAKIEQKKFFIDYSHDEYRFISGHVIDDRNFFPATQYLNLVWQTLAQSRRAVKADTPVIFKDCKFKRAVIPKNGFVNLLVTLKKGSGHFEVLEKNSIIVSGTIQICNNVSDHQTNPQDINFEKQKKSQILEKDEIYREFVLRGYNYSGLFKGIEKYHIDASVGLLKWNYNWTTFIDTMLQTKLQHSDTRLLHVPIGIKQLTIDPAKHIECAEKLYKKDSLFPVHVLADGEIIKSGGIEIRGLQSKSISKKRQRLEPVLETYEFVPNCCTLKLEEAVRVNTQIILENTLEIRFKSFEIIDEATNLKLENIMPSVCRALDDIPLIVPDLTIFSKTAVEEIPGIKIKHTIPTPENNFLLIIGTDILQRLKTMEQLLLNSLNEKGFILSREKIDFSFPDIENFEIVTEYITPHEKLILFKKSIRYKYTKFVKIASTSLDWLPTLQNSIKHDTNIVAYSNGIQPEGLVGLLNCVRREPNGRKVKGFLIIDETEKFNPEIDLFKDQIKKNLAINVYKNKTWGTYRHLPLKTPPEIKCKHVFANVTIKGNQSSLKWLEGGLTPQTPVPKKNIYVSTYYSAVNFKDIMAASGRVNIETLTSTRIDQEFPIGFEFSGKDLNGRRVAGMSQTGALSPGVIGDRAFLWEIPKSWSLKDGATVPVVYATVLYALTMVRDLKRGSSILIHSGTGGVGLATLNVCLYYDCEIFVTVGTQEKREYLRRHYPQIPSSHIGNSRDNSFEDMIKNETRGRGVDIVLNSLSDDKLLASVRCLVKGGRFLEIGRFDLSNDTTLNLLLLEKEISYHGIMLDQIFRSSESMKENILNAVYDGIRDGYVKPLPTTVFNMQELETAYRYMTTGKRIGKVLIKIRDEEENKTSQAETELFKATPRFNCDIRYSYIVIGGLGGVGLEVADWLVLRGARKLILVTRTGVQNGYQTKRTRIWESYGTVIRVFTENVTNRKGCINLIKHAKELGPVDAIFNLAVVLNDALLEDQTKETFLTTLEPKAQMTIHLDQVSRKLCPNLRYFVTFSSVSCGRGNVGQCNYGMANSVMERICEKRKDDGLPATAIQWGAIGDVGLVAKLQKENKELVISGTLQQKISSCLEVLDILLKQDRPVVSSTLVAEKRTKSYGNDNIVNAVAHILGIKDIRTVSQHATLPELGMDSIMGTEIALLLEKDFEIYQTPTELRSLTLTKLTTFEIEKKASGSRKRDVLTNGNVYNFDRLFQLIRSNEKSHLPLIKLRSRIQEDENTKTIFLFPGIEGDFQLLEPFVQQLKVHVIGVQYNYIDPEDTVQEMTENIIPHIEKEIFPEKIFHFIGYSFGTVIATEIAYLLEEKGYTGKVILIDGTPVAVPNALNEYLPAKNDREFQILVIYRILSSITPLDAAYKTKEKFFKCKNLSERIDLGLSLIPKELKDKQKAEKQAILTLYKRFKAITRYKAPQKKLKSQVYLFKAQHTLIKGDYKHQLSEICDNVVPIRTIEGGHITMLKNTQLIDSVNDIIRS